MVTPVRLNSSLRSARDFLVKPPPVLPIVSALVAPEWQWFWKEKPVFLAYPWQVDKTQIVDAYGAPLASTGTPALVAGKSGTFLQVNSTSYYERIGGLGLSRPFTMIFFGHSPGDLDPGFGGDRHRFLWIGDKDSATAQYGLTRSRQPSLDAWSMMTYETDFSEILIDTPGLATQTYDGILLSGVWRTDTDRSFYAGNERADDSVSRGAVDWNSISIGRFGDSSPLATDGLPGTYWGAILPIDMTFEQHLQLNHDPYGPFRMHDIRAK